MKLKVTWPSGKTRIEHSYASPEALIAGMFVSGRKPDDVLVESMEGEAAEVTKTPETLPKATPASAKPAQPAKAVAKKK